MKWISPLISDGRNKLGGVIFARNRAGVYQRARVTPANPQTTFQQANRAMFSTIVTAWRALTVAQRLSWNNLALSCTLTDSLGQTSMPSGFQLFTSRNRNRLLLGLAQLTDAPVSPTSPPYVTFFFGTYYWAGAGLDVMTIVLVTSASLTGYSVVFGATAALSPGIQFVAPHLYRTIAHDVASTQNWDWSAQWNTQFSASAMPGLNVATYCRLIHATSGLEVAKFTGLTPIVAE